MKKKRIIGIILIVLLGVFSINYAVVRADSGFDSSFGGGGFGGGGFGGGGFGGGDFGGSSWGGSSSGSDDSFTSLDFYLIILVIVIILIMSVMEGGSNKDYAYKISIPDRYRQMNIEAMKKFNKYFPDEDINEYYESLYKLFEIIQNAWTKFDYDTLRDVLTDELYNSYRMQLKTLKRKKQINQMSDFIPIEAVLFDLIENDDKTYSFKFALRYAFFDYLTTEEGKLISGDKKTRIDILYEITLVGTPNAKLNFCPNCGAKLDESASNVCPYCNSTIVSNQHKLVMSKKECIRQGWYSENRRDN